MKRDETPEAVSDAHKHSSNHRAEILDSEQCGCFKCLAIFSPKLIDEWWDDDDKGVGQTATCPKCGIDSVIGSASGYPITKDFLKALKSHAWGGRI